MDTDFYDDLPEIYETWADQYRELKTGIVISAKIVAIPVSLFVATCVFNYYINKKWNSL